MINEPVDRSIVGWDDPISAAYVRIDQYANEEGDLRRWFLANEHIPLAVYSWEDLLLLHRHRTGPYLLRRDDAGL